MISLAKTMNCNCIYYSPIDTPSINLDNIMQEREGIARGNHGDSKGLSDTQSLLQ